MKKYNIAAIAILVAILVIPNVASVSMTLYEPKNINYTYSINLPINYSASGDATTCFYNIDGVENVTLANCAIGAFEVNYDGTYNLTVFVQNATTMVSGSVVFGVDRDFSSGKGVLIMGLIVIIASLATFFIFISKNLGDTADAIKYFMFGLSFYMIVFSIRLSSSALREYIKFPAFFDIIISLYNVLFWSFWVIFAYLIFDYAINYIGIGLKFKK